MAAYAVKTGLELHEPAPIPNGMLPHQNGVAGKSVSPAPPQLTASNTQAGQVGLGRPPLGRDPKSRARSRDYLKQCLQEITYLTSPQAVNPLPNRPLAVGGIGGSASVPNLPVSIPNLPTFSVNDYAQQQQLSVQQQHQQYQQQAMQQQQPQQQQQQVQILPQPQIQPASQFSNMQQTPGTIHIPAGNMQTLTTMGRPRKTVPDVVNVFPQPPNDQSEPHDQSQDQQQAFPSSESLDDERGAPEDSQDLVSGAGFSVSEHDTSEEDLQAVMHMGDDDNETVDGRMHESSSPPPPEADDEQVSFEPAPSSSGSSDGFSEPGTPASMIHISLAGEDGESEAREPGPFTAIYRPDDKGAWREKLRAAHEEEMQRQQEQQQQGSCIDSARGRNSDPILYSLLTNFLS